MTAPTLSNNSPSAGFISWTAFNVSYSPTGAANSNVDAAIAAGNTDKRFVIYKYNSGSPTTIYSDTIPAGLDDKADLLLFVNRSGIGIYAYRTGYVAGDLLIDGSVYTDALATGAVVADTIAADAITADKLAADSVTARSLSAGSVGALSINVGAMGPNVMINPQFEDWDTTTIYNHVKNPYASLALTDISKWAGTGGTCALTRVTTGGPDADHPTHANVTWSVASSSAGGAYFKTDSGLVPGSKMSVGVKVKPGTTQNMYVGVSCYNASNASTGSLSGTSTSCTGGAWTQLTYENFTVPAGTAYLYVLAYFTSAVAITQTLKVAMAGCVDGPTYYYYDGDSMVTINGYDYGFCWKGAAGDSSTIRLPYEWFKNSYASGSYVGQMFGLDATTPITGTKSLGAQAGSGGLAAAVGRLYPATPTDSFYAKAKAKCSTAITGGVAIGFAWFDKNLTQLSADLDVFSTVNGTVDVEYWGAAPASTAYCAPVILSGVTSTMVYFDNLEMGQRLTSVKIEDGAIQATKLSLGSVGENKSRNGNFQDIDKAGYVVGWDVVGTGTSGTADLYTVDRRSGDYALKLTRNAGVGSIYVLGELFLVAEGKEYYYSAVARASGASMASGAYIELQWYDGSQTYISSSYILSNAALSTSWGPYEGRFSPATNSRYARVKLKNELASSSMLVDEVFVRESITGSLIVNGAIDGKTITGAVVQTASGTGERLVLRNDGSGGILESYCGLSGETPGVFNPSTFSGKPAITIRSGTTATYPDDAAVVIVSDTSGNGYVFLDGSYLYFTGISTFNGNATFNNQVTVASGGLTVSSGGVSVAGTSSFTNSVTVYKLTVNTPTSGSAIPNTRYNSGASGGELLYTSHANSSKRYKKNVKRLELSHDQMYGLRPVRYNLKKKAPDRPADYEFWGFIAEEMEDLGMATLLGYDDEGRPDEVDYAKVVVVQQAAICDLNERVESLENQVSELSDLVTDLMARLDDQE